jgi:signal transduction histidine kinase
MTTKNQQVFPFEDFSVIVGGTAHDLNNLLAGAQLQASLAIRKLPSDNPAAPHIARVIEAMEHMTSFVDNLMSQTKGGQSRNQADLNGLIIKCVNISRLIIREDVRIELDFFPDLPLLHADKIQVQQLILNLILNAAESLGQSIPDITISTGYLSSLDSDSESGWWVTGESGCQKEMIYFEIKDAGTGISRETLQRVFDPYYTTKEKGRGLGLPLVLEVVRSHSGRLLVRSSPGEGTVFKAFFPVSQKEGSSGSLGQQARVAGLLRYYS